MTARNDWTGGDERVVDLPWYSQSPTVRQEALFCYWKCWWVVREPMTQCDHLLSKHRTSLWPSLSLVTRALLLDCLHSGLILTSRWGYHGALDDYFIPASIWHEGLHRHTPALVEMAGALLAQENGFNNEENSADVFARELREFIASANNQPKTKVGL
jgi:hypothetical protein